MKKLILLLSLLSFNANAKGFYIGLDYQSVNLNLREKSTNGITPKLDEYYNSKYLGASPIIGYEFDDISSIEVSYFTNTQEKTNNNTGLIWTSGSLSGQAVETSSLSSIDIYNINTVHKLKISNNFALTALVGGSIINFNLKESYNNGYSINEGVLGYGLNAGLGAEVSLSTHIALTISGKYTKTLGLDLEKTNGTSGVDSFFTYGGGIKYYF